MKEISMHILDIAMNSVKAMATLIEIEVDDSVEKNCLRIIIKDNGTGMSKDMLTKVTDPFFTTRTTRRVGLGLPMLKESCERCNGKLTIDSQLGGGTRVECFFERNNIDRAPMGNMGETIMTIINSLHDCELIYIHSTDRGMFSLSTKEVKNILDEGQISDSSVLLWIKEYINENIRELSIN